MKHNYLSTKSLSTTGTFRNNKEVETSVHEMSHMQEPHFNSDRILKPVPRCDPMPHYAWELRCKVKKPLCNKWAIFNIVMAFHLIFVTKGNLT
jgi:hypothetical protein